MRIARDPVPASEAASELGQVVATSELHRTAAWLASHPVVVVAIMRCNPGVRLQ